MTPPRIPRPSLSAAPPLPGLPVTHTFFDGRRAGLPGTLQLQVQPDHDAEIQQLKGKLGKRGPKSLCVIDMTGAAKPVVAGWDDERMVQIASMAKLAALYAAFQLRDDLRAVVDWSGARDFAKLEAALRKAWGTAPGPAVKALAGLPEASLPQLSRIFDVEAFKSGADRYPELKSDYGASSRQGSYHDDYYRDLGRLHVHDCAEKRPPAREAEKVASYEKCYAERYEQLAKVPFNELLHLMVRWSDNEAASACISMLGLPFIQAMLVHRGLFTERRGLWLGGGYRELIGPAFRPLGPTTTKPVKNPDGTNAESTQAGTARSVALLLAALIRGDLLVSGGDLMKAMLDFSSLALLPGSPENVFLFTGLRPAPRVYLSKVGILGTWHSEGAYVLTIGTPPVRAHPDDPLQSVSDRSFVAVALQAPDSEVMTECGQQLEHSIDRLNARD